MKVVMDCGNAAAANAPSIFKDLGVELKELFVNLMNI